MTNDNVPRIKIGISPSVSNEDYIKWNIEGASRRIRNAPGEIDITLQVYNIHKEILRNRGVSESEFSEGDKIIDDLVKKYSN